MMIILRGASGSGKSHLARAIVNQTVAGDHRNHIFSTDNFFCRHGRYEFDASQLPQAHEFNHKEVARRAVDGWSPILVDNTNIKLWEMFPYVTEAVKNGYVLHLLEPNTPWNRDASELVDKNQHNVPMEKIEKSLKNFQHTSVENLLRVMKVSYDCDLPQLREFPPFNPKKTERSKNQPKHRGKKKVGKRGPNAKA